MPKIFINIPIEASTHKYPAMFPYPLLILNIKNDTDILIDLVKENFKKNAKQKRQELDKIITSINNNEHNNRDIVINCGEYAPDGYYYKWAEYFLKRVNKQVYIMGPYATTFPSRIQKICEKTKIQHAIFDTNYDTHKVFIPDHMLLNYPKIGSKIKANMRISLGCPRPCAFCPVGIIYKRNYQFFDINESIAKVRYYYEHGVRAINFIDDNISVDLNQFIEFLHKLKELDFKDMSYYCQEGFEVASFHNDEFCKLLKELKFQDIKIGVENIDEQFLDDIGKAHLRFKDIELAIKNIRLYKLKVKFFFLLSQFQTKEKIIENLRFFSPLQVDLRVNIIRNYEGAQSKVLDQKLTLKELRKLKSFAYAVAYMSTAQKFDVFQKNAWQQYCLQKGYKLNALDEASYALEGKQYFGFKTSKWLTALQYILRQEYKTDNITIDYNKKDKRIGKIILMG